MQIHWEGNAGSIEINGTVYELQQAHWHSPSEHSINGRTYSLELHMVHKSTDPTSKHQIAVIGVLYKIGTPNPFLAKVNPERLLDISLLTVKKKLQFFYRRRTILMNGTVKLRI